LACIATNGGKVKEGQEQEVDAMATTTKEQLRQKDAQIEALKARLAAVDNRETPGYSVKANSSEEAVKYGDFTLVKTFANGYTRQFGLGTADTALAVAEAILAAVSPEPEAE
jgi:hypothetical protein